MPIDVTKYRNLTADNKDLEVDFRPLNFEKLLKAKAVRVTNRGNNEGGYDKDPSVGFSLVSGINDASSPKGGTNLWPDNPKFYDIVKDMFVNRPHDLAAHKYLQIVNSARDLGLKDKDIFLPTTTMPKDYRKGGRTKLI